MGMGMSVPVRRALVPGMVGMSGVAGTVAILVLIARAGFAAGGGGAGSLDGGWGAGFRTPTLPASASRVQRHPNPSKRHVRRALSFPGLEPSSARVKSESGTFAVWGARFAVRGAGLAVGAGVPAAQSAARFRDPAERGRGGGEEERTQVKVNADEGGARTVSGF